MTPARMLKNYGSDTKCLFQVGDNVRTPNGYGKIVCEFSRGLKWWVETSVGTYLAETINNLNTK